ncbi:hypothetical protein Y1Q_0000712 [Alligator mississippiensis]|uniref:Uncharacterized protein n=1 Tax=Alligator mississippiensis TaxID=8496 RepID=A0A151MC63_ALLMI|nr:hypothetical protein Y1Q_0000712 [Alligator mississippiensis]
MDINGSSSRPENHSKCGIFPPEKFVKPLTIDLSHDFQFPVCDIISGCCGDYYEDRNRGILLIFVRGGTAFSMYLTCQTQGQRFRDSHVERS